MEKNLFVELKKKRDNRFEKGDETNNKADE
jgi:hypothetical protein